MICAIGAIDQPARSGAHDFRSHRPRSLLMLRKFCRIRLSCSVTEVHMSLRLPRLFKFMAGSAFVLAIAAIAYPQEFYKGKTIVFIVGTAPGEASTPTAGLQRVILENIFPEIRIPWFRTCRAPGI